jgi:hypothetical protein
MTDTPTRYFGGRSVHDGRTRRVTAENFKQLVESQIHVPVAFPMKRRDFLAHEDRDKLKDGPWVGAATYGADECARGNNHATGFSLVIIDLDGGPEAADFAQSPDTIRDALKGLSFVAWTTAKHTPAEPRIKIMVDCASDDRELFKRAVTHVIGMLGLPADFKGKSESLVISQPQYRPMHFQGEEYSAVIASRLDGKRLDPTTLPDTDEAPAPDGGYAYVPEPGEMDIGNLLNLPLPDITLEDVRSALFAIDADIGYRPWCDIACALRHQFTGEDEASEAFAMFHEWSMTGGKYKDREDCLRKWRSFKPYPEGRHPITVRTLFHRAGRAGWKADKMTTRHDENFTKWCEENDPTVVRDEGIRKIAAIPIPSDVTEEMMAEQIVIAVKRGGNTITKTAILKDVKRLRRQEKVGAAQAEKPSWMLPFCFIGPRDRFRNTITGREYTVDAFNHTFGRHLIGVDGEMGVPAAHYALYIAEIKVVDDSMYDPRQSKGGDTKTHGEDIYFEKEGQWFVNTYLKSSVPDASLIGAERAGNLVKALIAANIPDPGYARTILDWIAFCVQFPGHKIRWSPFLQGGQGCGKGTLMDTAQASIGFKNFRVITGANMTGSGFNEWREGAHLNYIDELFSAGTNRHEVNNSLKDAIANDTIPVMQKFRDLRNIDNVTNYFVTSNKHDALVLEDSDRRYMVLKSRLQTRGQILAFLATGVCDRIHELIKSNPGAFRQFYLSHEISEDFDPNGHAPDTVFRHELVDAGKNPMLIQIEDLIADPAYPLIGEDVIHYAQVERETALLGRNNARASHYLHVLGFRAYQNAAVFEVGGERTRIYVSIENFIEGVDDPIELLEERMPELP